jgi:2-hydroxy-6-oxonona-2,4-dienedioate hydrolase
MYRAGALSTIEEAGSNSASEASSSWGQQALEETSSLLNKGTEKRAVVRPCMAKSIFQFVKDSLPKLGSADPLWLKEEAEPVFKTVEMGTQGPEMVLLHGLFGALSNWDAVQPLMAKYAKPIALSFPLLTAHRSEVKVKSLALYTDYFLRTRKIHPTTLCGNSLGGHVALRLYLAAPELVDCLVLTATSGLYEHSVDSLPVRPGREFVLEHMAKVFKNEKFITEEAVEEIVKILNERSHVLNLIHAARSAKKDNLKDVLGQVKVPTLLLWGEDDQVTTMEVAEMFHQLIPNSTLVTVKNCGHAPMIEHPEWFADEVEKFLRKNSRHPLPQK